MAKITPIRVTEQFEDFLREMKESFWGDLYGKTRLAWKKFWDAQSLRERDSYMVQNDGRIQKWDVPAQTAVMFVPKT